MNSAQIDTLLRNDPCSRFTFAGVFPRDHLSKLVKARTLPAAYVVNTDPATKPGEHWVAFYFPVGGKAEYFDSYGDVNVHEAFVKFGMKYGHHQGVMKMNRHALQGTYSTVCGQYCIFFVLLRCRGYSFEQIVRMFDKDNVNWNDSMVARFVNKHCGENLPVTDYQFLLQYCLSKTR